MQLDDEIGCGLWLIPLLVGIIGAEATLLWVSHRLLPDDVWLLVVFIIVVATIIGGSLATYLGMQWRS
jgi:hypothetical protein